MFLSVSQSCCKQSRFRSILLVTLLMASATVCAESPPVAAKGAEKPVDSIAPATQTQQNQVLPEQAQHFNFPRWPQYRQGNKEIIPPPPPGPYMSYALRDYPPGVPAPGHRYAAKPAPMQVKNLHAPAHGHAPTSMPMDMYSPDIPWPKHLRPESRVPDYPAARKGSRYLAPMAARPSPYAAAPDKKPGHYYRNGQPPHRDGANMDRSRWVPGMGMSPAANDDNRLNYAPNFGSNHGVRHSRPVMNNDAKTFTDHAYR